MTDAVDPENPRPEGHYPRFRSNTWHYVPDELAQTISLGPADDGELGQDWVLSYTPERRRAPLPITSSEEWGRPETVDRSERSPWL